MIAGILVSFGTGVICSEYSFSILVENTSGRMDFIGSSRFIKDSTPFVETIMFWFKIIITYKSFVYLYLFNTRGV